MREILDGVFTWGGPYPDAPWDLNGYAIRTDNGTVIIDPPQPEGPDWSELDALKPIKEIVVTNRSHAREVGTFRSRYQAPVAAGSYEVRELAPLVVDEPLHEGDLLPGGLRVIHLPGKSPGEIGLYFDPALNPTSRAVGGILLLGDAIIGHPPGQLGLIPESKLDNPSQLRQSLHKLQDYDFNVLLLCDGQSVLSGAKQKVAAFLSGLR